MINGVFFRNSKTRLHQIRDGTSKTVMVGERSKGWLDTKLGVAGEFDSTWVGVVTGSPHTGWRVLGWTGEPPNHDPGTNSEIHFHGFAQYNSPHAGGVVLFAFGDGAVHPVREEVDAIIFRALGSTRGGEVFSISDL